MYYICDKCKKPILNKEEICKALTYKGLSWKGKRTAYVHRHYHKKCFEEVFE
jgi:hypothetical protein